MIIIKIGGSVVDSIHNTIMNNIKNISKDHEIIFVHGGGKEVTKISEQLGKKPEFIISASGIRSRYTDKNTMEIFTMTIAGKINKLIVSKLQKNNINAIGLSGVDGKLIQADRKKKLIIINEKGRKQIIDGGYTGKVNSINDKLLKILIQQNYVPVISPIAISNEFELLNIDGDRAAANIAGKMKSDILLFLTNVDGLFLDDKLIKQLDVNKAKKMMNKIGFGMEKKILASIEALKMGVKKVIIANGKKQNPLLSALAYNNCTVIQND